MKKSRKKYNSNAQLIIGGLVAVFGLLLILPMFLNMLSDSITAYTIFNLSEIIVYSGKEISALTTITMVLGFVAIGAGILLAVTELLNICGLKLPRGLYLVLSLITVLMTITSFVLVIILSGSASASTTIGGVGAYKIDVASYLLLTFGLVSGGLGLILHAKK